MIYITALTTNTIKHFYSLTLCNMLHELQRYDKAMARYDNNRYITHFALIKIIFNTPAITIKCRKVND